MLHFRSRNRSFVRCSISLLMLLFAACGGNDALTTKAPDRSIPPKPDSPPSISFPDFLDTTLANGLRVFLIESNQKPSLTIRLVVRGGSAYDGDKNGLAAATATLLGKGSSRRSALEFAKEGDFIGASYGSGTTEDALYINISGLKKHQDKLFDIFTDAVFNPTFPEDELDKFKRQALSGLQARRRTPSTLSSIINSRVAFGEHPYAALDDEASISGLSSADVLSFYKRHFNASNASLAIVGDFKTGEMLNTVNSLFGNWSGGSPAPELDTNFPRPNGVTVHLVDLPGAVQSSISVVIPATARRNPELAELSVINSILGGGFSGRLFQNLRETHGWTYGAYATGNYYRAGGFIVTGAEVRNAVTDSAIVEMMAEIKRLRSEPVAEPELELHRQYLSGNYLLSLENAERTLVRAQDIAVFGVAKEYYKKYVERVSAMTPEKVSDIAQKYLGVKNVYVTVVGDAKSIKASLERIGPVTVYDTDLNPVSDYLPADLSETELLAKHFAAQGGAAALKKWTSSESKGKLSISVAGRSLDGTVESKEKAPNKAYTKIVTPLFVQELFVDGKRVVEVSAQGTKEYTGEELSEKLELATFNLLFNLSQSRATFTLLGMKPTDSGVNYVGEVAYPSGKKSRYVFEGSSFLITESYSMERNPQGGEMEVKVEYSDFRPVPLSKNKRDWVLRLPHKITRYVPFGPNIIPFEITISEYALNKALNDQLFIKK